MNGLERTENMRRTLLAFVMATVALLGFSPTSTAKPVCQVRVSCGAQCVGSQGGGFCSGSTEEPAYCYQESVTSDYETWVFSCHDGNYDYCCDDEYLY